MAKENIIQNSGAKYSEMLIEIIEEFDKKLLNKFTLDEILVIVVDAWNLANNKEYLEKINLFKKELKRYETM